MAISLQNILRFAENSGQNPDGSPFIQRSGPNALTYPLDETPLITKDILGVDEATNGTLGLINEVTDNFVRGGAIALGNAAIDDLKRLGKVLISPNGLAWGVSQIALARTNPLGPILPKATGVLSFLQSTTGGPRNRQSLPIGVLATAGTGAAGVRFRKDGLLDVKFESGYNYDISKGGPKYESSLRERLDKNKEDFPDGFTLRSIYDNVNTFDVGGINIKEYSGGPHSTFGIGNTEIKKYKSNPFNDIGKNGGYLPLFNQKLFPLRQAPLTPSSIHKDYRSEDSTKAKSIPNDKTRINLYNIGDPGVEINDGSDYSVYDVRTVDKISAKSIFERQNLKELGPELKDYIKFRIAVVNTDNPTNDRVILFRALLDNIADNFSGEWNSFKYNGRAEKFYTYGGFDRSIDFGFKIHAQTRHEQKPLWEKLNYLVAQTAPEYKNRRMRGVFSRLTIGDWMHEIPGFFTSVNLSWNTAYPWEIQHDPTGLDSDVNQYPHILDVSCNFQPIHNFAPSNSPSTPFLLPDKSLRPQGEDVIVKENEEEAESITENTISTDIPTIDSTLLPFDNFA
tara:strand:+ start:353 stop:2053 length:1701 start_codon:yes stop_codon:yes gene_type:complete